MAGLIQPWPGAQELLAAAWRGSRGHPLEEGSGVEVSGSVIRRLMSTMGWNEAGEAALTGPKS